MPTGRFDKSVEVQSRGGTEDAGGNVSASFGTFAVVWGSLEDTSGRELYRAQQVDPTIDSVVALRERLAGLGSDMRLVVSERTFEIKAILGRSDRGMREGQVIHCTEEV